MKVVHRAAGAAARRSDGTTPNRPTLSRCNRSKPLVVVIIGVSGSGKTSIGRSLAPSLGATFIEGDLYHSAENIARMRAGVALDDVHRWPWLKRLGRAAAVRACAGRSVVVSCSALRRCYRDVLRDTVRHHAIFVHLSADEALIESRQRARRQHFMPASLLRSQFAALEPLEGDEPGFGVVPATTLARTVTVIRWRLRQMLGA